MFRTLKLNWALQIWNQIGPGVKCRYFHMISVRQRRRNSLEKILWMYILYFISCHDCSLHDRSNVFIIFRYYFLVNFLMTCIILSYDWTCFILRIIILICYIFHLNIKFRTTQCTMTAYDTHWWFRTRHFEIDINLLFYVDLDEEHFSKRPKELGRLIFCCFGMTNYIR